MTADHLNLQGSQLGDPIKGAAIIIEQLVSGGGSLRQLLGSDAHSYATAKLADLHAMVDAAAETAPTTDFPAA